MMLLKIVTASAVAPTMFIRDLYENDTGTSTGAIERSNVGANMITRLRKSILFLSECSATTGY